MSPGTQLQWYSSDKRLQSRSSKRKQTLHEPSIHGSSILWHVGDACRDILQLSHSSSVLSWDHADDYFENRLDNAEDIR